VRRAPLSYVGANSLVLVGAVVLVIWVVSEARGRPVRRPARAGQESALPVPGHPG
jgi:hypothetical protein